METEQFNANDIVETFHNERVASHGPSYAEVQIALFRDELYRYGIGLRYSYGGFVAAIYAHSEGYAGYRQAKEAALQDLLRRWHKPSASQPKSVHVELRAMRQQIKDQLRQSSLL